MSDPVEKYTREMVIYNMFIEEMNDEFEFKSCKSTTSSLKMHMHKNSQIIYLSLKGNGNGSDSTLTIFPTLHELDGVRDILIDKNSTDRRTCGQLIIQRLDSSRVLMTFVNEDREATTLWLNQLEAAGVWEGTTEQLAYLEDCGLLVEPTAPHHFLRELRH